jgi:L-gulonate 5-dehydrogenase
VLPHQLARRLVQLRRNGLLPYLRPDGKTQVTVRYDEAGRPARVEKVLISAQHEDGVEAKLPDALWEQVVTPVLPPDMYDPGALRREVYVNPTGRFGTGVRLPDKACRRKIIVDTYGGSPGTAAAPSPARTPARWTAAPAAPRGQNIVARACRRARSRCYAIRMARPLSCSSRRSAPRRSTGRESRTWSAPISPAAPRPINALDLRRQIDRPTAADVHFVRDESGFTWERTDRAAALRTDAGLLSERSMVHAPATGSPDPGASAGRAQRPPARLWSASGIPRSFLGAVSLSSGNGRGNLRISVRQCPVSPPFMPMVAAAGKGPRKGLPVLAAVTRSPGEMVIEDVSDPGPARAGNVIIGRRQWVSRIGLPSVSGDVAALSGARDFYPRIQGHEVSAIVEDPGDTATKEGERVAIWPLLPCGSCYPCRAGRPNVCPRFRLVGVHLDGGLQQRLEVTASTVFGVGDLDPDSPAFVEPASVAVHALARANLKPGEQAVVFGAGPIGLATTLAASQAGARVTTVDPIPARRDLAKRLGAERVTWGPHQALYDELRDWTNGEGPPLVVETSGETEVLPAAVHMISAAGRVVVVGMSSGTVPLRPGVFPEKEIDVLGSSCATAEDFRTAITLVKSNRASLAALFSHHFPLTRAGEAFEFAMKRPPDAIKIVVTVN